MLPPVFDQCYAISLPEYAKLDQDAKQANQAIRKQDLQRLKASISAINQHDTYLNRLESSIQLMCDDLKSQVQESWFVSFPVFL